MLEKIALQKGLISKKDFNEAIAACKNADHYEIALKNYFISNNIISAKKINQLLRTLSALKTMKIDANFGQAALKLKFINKKILQAALLYQKKAFAQKKSPKRIGQILFEAGKLSKEQISQIVKLQKQGSIKAESVPEVQTEPEQTLPEHGSIDQTAKGPSQETTKALEKEDIKEKQAGKTTIEVEGGMILEIDESAMAAHLKKTDEFNESIGAEDIYAILAGNMIQFGVVDEQMIEGFIKSSGFKTNSFRVASGIERIVGINARIEYYFDTDYLKAGGMDEEGNIDFKERGDIPKIEEGTLLAQKFPLKLSKSGRNIYGEELGALPVNDIDLKTQTGAVVSEDGNQLYAEISGYPKLTWSGNINVLDEFQVKGDVNYQTGHVTYQGNIDVRGCLKSGFNITGNIVKIQEVDGGTIIADGDVTIINGVNNATIRSRGHVNAKFIHNATISCLGNLNVEKEIVDSKIAISGTCNIKHGEIINSQIIANKGIQAKNIGTSKTAPNHIHVGIDTYLDNELKQIDETVSDIDWSIKNIKKKAERLKLEKARYQESAAKIANELEKCRNEGQSLKNDISQIENPSDKNKELKNLKRQLKQNESQFNRLDKELNDCFDIIENNSIILEEIEEKRLEFEETLEDLAYEKDNFTEWGKANAGSAEVIIDGKAFAETLIKGPHSQLELKENIGRAKIKEILLQNDSGASYDIYEMQINDNN